MQWLLRCLAVGAAGSVGALLRLFVADFFNSYVGVAFPLGTFVINITGSMFLGWFITVAGRGNISDITKTAIATGFVGAYTTFSTFAYESNKLVQDGAEIKAALNIVGSVVVGLLAVRTGIWLAGPQTLIPPLGVVFRAL